MISTQIVLPRRKELGQYFSGKLLANLLACLAGSENAKTIIDPMCGIGDMLISAHRLHKQSSIYGIEIDPDVFQHLKEALSKYDAKHIINGSAFSLKTIEALPIKEFDLVITNPPYVRYQRLNSAKSKGLDIPIASEIRSSLVEMLKILPGLDELDQKYFKILIENYSGLSDLAVPAWLLCSMLTKVGGKLAVVVPDTWLNRDYALLIQYVLLRWFKIEYIVEDEHSKWFSDAQVKTTLVIAERTKRRESAFLWADETYKYVVASSKAMNEKSIVGNCFPHASNPDKDFFNALTSNSLIGCDLVRVQDIPLQRKASALLLNVANARWIEAIEGKNLCTASVNKAGSIPNDLAALIDDTRITFANLESFGVSVGQGLRTGANKFFYVDIVEQDGENYIIKPDPILGVGRVKVPRNCLWPVLRKQKELDGQSYILDCSKLTGGALLLGGYILPEDLQLIQSATPSLFPLFQTLSDELANLIRVASKVNFGSKEEPKIIHELSAVKPNIKKWNPSKPFNPPSFWYMLPQLTKRHLPDLFVARINNMSPRTILSINNNTVVDANFSTIWVNSDALYSKYLLLALLNSDWCVVAMEKLGTVMGGGALKLEASHLKKLPIPTLTPEQISDLTLLGENLASTDKPNEILEKINSFVGMVIFGQNNLQQRLDSLKAIKMQSLVSRSH